MYLLGKILCILIALTACVSQVAVPANYSKVNENHVDLSNWQREACEIKVPPKGGWEALAEHTEVPASILRRYNKLKLLKIGQEIRVPARKIYQVKRGETAIGIAVKYGMTFSELISLNNLEPPFELKDGQSLKIVEISTRIFTHKSNNTKKLVLNWPVNGEIVSNFGVEKNGALNDGIRILVLNNSSVKAAAAGTVVYVGNEIGSYGNVVIIQHKGEWLSSYGNLNKISVAKGDIVKMNQIIGEIDNAKLYFGLRNGATPVNPFKYIAKMKKDARKDR